MSKVFHSRASAALKNDAEIENLSTGAQEDDVEKFNPA
jgi:hypothetical protein